MPCHGEYRMLLKHGETAMKCGIDPDKIFVMDNGDVLKCKTESVEYKTSRSWYFAYR